MLKQLSRLASICLFGCLLASATLSAQSLDPKNPAPLAEGPNRGTVDSFAGMQFWYFTAKPGHFHLEFHEGSTEEGFNAGGHATAAIVFAPKLPGSKMTLRELRGATIFDGDVLREQRVVIGVEPANSKLVRQSTGYTLTATGSASFAAGEHGADALAAAGTPVLGTYTPLLGQQGRPDLGPVKFLPGGRIESASGETGEWKLFDADTNLYKVSIGYLQGTYKLQPGRGLADTRNGNLIFQMVRRR
jgi:hypothetical protein